MWLVSVEPQTCLHCWSTHHVPRLLSKFVKSPCFTRTYHHVTSIMVHAMQSVLVTTSIQRPPLFRDHLYSETTSIQRPPLFKYHLYSETTSIQRPYSETTSIQRPPPFRDHLYSETTSIQIPCILETTSFTFVVQIGH